MRSMRRWLPASSVWLTSSGSPDGASRQKCPVFMVLGIMREINDRISWQFLLELPALRY
jgi:hypothetical protein